MKNNAIIRFAKKIYCLMHDIYTDRSLLASLSWQDFKRRFAGSYFGTVWGFVNPLLTMIVYWVVFQFGFRSGDVGEVPFILWFMCGIVAWLFISEAFSAASSSFLEYSYLVKKVVFNINILPLVKIISCLYIHLFFIGLLSSVCILFGYYPSVYWIQIVYYLFCSITFLFAITLTFSSVMIFFRDLGQIIGIILLVGMWGTPIAWSINTFPRATHFFFKLNPIYYIVEGYRDCFVNQIWFWEKYNQTAYFWVLTVMMLFIGTVVFCRLRPHFSDIL